MSQLSGALISLSINRSILTQCRGSKSLDRFALLLFFPLHPQPSRQPRHSRSGPSIILYFSRSLDRQLHCIKSTIMGRLTFVWLMLFFCSYFIASRAPITTIFKSSFSHSFSESCRKTILQLLVLDSARWTWIIALRLGANRICSKAFSTALRLLLLMLEIDLLFTYIQLRLLLNSHVCLLSTFFFSYLIHESVAIEKRFIARHLQIVGLG
jgi:hypothetical protein